MNFFLITVDSLRKDRMSYYGNTRNTTPFLDKIIEENTLYDNAYSTSCHTREAMPSILTGQTPQKALEKYEIISETIAEKLSSKGVQTNAYITGPFLTEKNNYHKGFQNFNNDYKLNRTFPEYFWKILRNNHFRDGYELNKLASKQLKENSFTWIHYMDVHAPYNNFENWKWGEERSDREIQRIYRKAKYSGDISREEHRLILDCYDNSLRYLDNVLKDLFSRLDGDTEFIICGDHGESFGEKGMYEHDFPRTLDDHRLEVPIIKKGDSKEVNQKVSTLGIFQQILKSFDLTSKNGLQETEGFNASCKNVIGRKVKRI